MLGRKEGVMFLRDLCLGQEADFVSFSNIFHWNFYWIHAGIPKSYTNGMGGSGEKTQTRQGPQ